MTVTGSNFLDLGRDASLCVFNRTVFTNATVLSDSLIVCDTPSILNKHGYSEVPEGGLSAYSVGISLDGGLQISETTALFRYYREPTVTHVSPALGPLKGGTTVNINGSGFGQTNGCKRVVRLGHVLVEPSSFTNDTMVFVSPAAHEPSTTSLAISLNGQQFTAQPAVHSPERSMTFDYYKDPYVSAHFPVRGPTNGGTQLYAQGFGFALKRSHLADQLWVRFVDTANKEKQLSAPTQV